MYMHVHVDAKYSRFVSIDYTVHVHVCLHSPRSKGKYSTLAHSMVNILNVSYVQYWWCSKPYLHVNVAVWWCCANLTLDIKSIIQGEPERAPNIQETERGFTNCVRIYIPVSQYACGVIISVRRVKFWMWKVMVVMCIHALYTWSDLSDNSGGHLIVRETIIYDETGKASTGSLWQGSGPQQYW